MFSFYDENILFAAKFGRSNGSVEAVDLRNRNSYQLFSSPTAHVKAVAFCPWEKHTLAVGVGDEVWFSDVRKRGENCILEKLSLDKIKENEMKCRKIIGPFLPFHGDEPDFAANQLSKSYFNLLPSLRGDEVSISSIEFSKCRREFLVSFQRDLIYRFSISASSSFGENCVNSLPVQYFSGFINDMTFLKRASYMGPDEEYVCCGGDDGNVFIFSSITGDLISAKQGDGIHGQFPRIHSSSNGIVNGVVPHPSHNSIVTYGLDNYAKLWVVSDKETDEPFFGKLEENMIEILTRTQKTLSTTPPPPPTLCASLIRCSRTRDNCLKRSRNYQYLPSSSLILAALDDEKLSVMDDLHGPSRFEYCVFKVEEIREKGNSAFHEDNYQYALELYSIAIHYCLGCYILRLELLHKLEQQQEQQEKIDAITELQQITTNTDFRPRYYPVRKNSTQREEITVEDIEKIIQAFKSIWSLFLVLNLNAAQACLKLKKESLALEFAKQALSVDSSSTKGKYRKALALIGLQKYPQALKELEDLRKLPGGDNELVRKKIEKLRQATKKSKLENL